jgi:dihydrofolate reductase
MILSIIVAMDEQRGIGHHGRLPWRLATDQRRFKAITMGHHLVMGRKTYESIGRLLPGRTMIVVTRNPTYRPEGCLVVDSIERGLRLAEAQGETEVFVIGGGEIYAKTLPLAKRIYLTTVHITVPADVFFPPLEEKDWIERQVEFIPAGEKDAYPTTFCILESVDNAGSGSGSGYDGALDPLVSLQRF